MVGVRECPIEVLIFNLTNTLLATRGERPHGLKLDALLFQGLYPRIHDRKLDAADFLEAYLSAYIERDVREVLRVGDRTGVVASVGSQ